MFQTEPLPQNKATACLGQNTLGLSTFSRFVHSSMSFLSTTELDETNSQYYQLIILRSIMIFEARLILVHSSLTCFLTSAIFSHALQQGLFLHPPLKNTLLKGQRELQWPFRYLSIYQNTNHCIVMDTELGLKRQILCLVLHIFFDIGQFLL